MKMSGLYFRMLAAFIVVQLIGVLTMYTLVHTGKIRPPFTRHAEERAVSIKRVVQRELAGVHAFTPELRGRLDSLLEVFASAFQGQVWITASDGTVFSQSFSGDVPLLGDEAFEHEMTIPGGDTLYLLEREDQKNLYVVGTFSFRDEPLTVHLLHKWKKRKEELWLMKGLLLMSCITALLLIPVSGMLTRPLKELTDSAKQVGRGDFSPRVKTRWSGEISVLAKAFNHMAESLERMVRGGQELTANLSHELRSPLARIRISQQIILERMESGRLDGIETHVRKMEAEIDHMDGLIDKILTLSKMDLQEPSPRNDVVDMMELLSETTQRHQTLLDDKSITVNQDHAPAHDLPCNREDLQIVLDNVLANAIKYSPDASTIELSSIVDGGTLSIRVTNPYPPLSPEELEAIFIPFKRLGYDTVDGNGLGLAFARKIIEEHGGTMEASNATNGFCMTVHIPL